MQLLEKPGSTRMTVGLGIDFHCKTKKKGKNKHRKAMDRELGRSPLGAQC